MRCPWHDEKTGSCCVYLDSHAVICFGCGKEAQKAEFLAQLSTRPLIQREYITAMNALADALIAETERIEKQMEVRH